MMFNEEEEFFYDFIEKDLESIKFSNRKELQRRKFKMISKLVDDIYNSKNSRMRFNLISNQLVLLLSLSNEKNGLDIFFDDEEDYIKDASDVFGDILKSELLGNKK